MKTILHWADIVENLGGWILSHQNLRAPLCQRGLPFNPHVWKPYIPLPLPSHRQIKDFKRHCKIGWDDTFCSSSLFLQFGDSYWFQILLDTSTPGSRTLTSNHHHEDEHEQWTLTMNNEHVWDHVCDHRCELLRCFSPCLWSNVSSDLKCVVSKLMLKGWKLFEGRVACRKGAHYQGRRAFEGDQPTIWPGSPSTHPQSVIYPNSTPTALLSTIVREHSYILGRPYLHAAYVQICA